MEGCKVGTYIERRVGGGVTGCLKVCMYVFANKYSDMLRQQISVDTVSVPHSFVSGFQFVSLLSTCTYIVCHTGLSVFG